MVEKLKSLGFPLKRRLGVLILMHSHRCFSVWRRLGATSENLGEIFTFRLPFPGCDACGLLWTPHSNRQPPIKSSKSMQGCHENGEKKQEKSNIYRISFKTSHFNWRFSMSQRLGATSKNLDDEEISPFAYLFRDVTPVDSSF